MEYLKNLELQNDIEFQVCSQFNQSNITQHLFGYFDEYKPLFGMGLPIPEFYINNIKINGKDIQTIGKAKTTIKFKHNGIDYIKFFNTHKWIEENNIGYNKDLNIEVIGELTNNIWNNNKYPQVLINKIEIKEDEINFDDLF